MDINVLERQRALLQCLYQQQQKQGNDHFALDSLVLQNHHHRQQQEQQQQQQQVVSRPVINNRIKHQSLHKDPRTDWQCNSSTSSQSLKKRKQELYIDQEEGGKEKLETKTEEAREEKSEITTKTERETSANTSSKVNNSEVQKPDYIHVRARRGQATDSHSLAERARREKISKKMKCLQDLVPGCSKVTGKAGMLDEIINYVQSLQKQVEFLSMKLAAINPRLDLSVDNFFAKEIPAYIANLPAAATQFEATNSTCLQYNPMQDISMVQSQMLPQKAGISNSVPIPEMFLDSSLIPQLQQLSGWESDLPASLFNAGFH